MGRVAFLSGTIFILAALTTPLGRCRWSYGMPKTFFFLIISGWILVIAALATNVGRLVRG